MGDAQQAVSTRRLSDCVNVIKIDVNEAEVVLLACASRGGLCLHTDRYQVAPCRVDGVLERQLPPTF